MPSIVFQEDKIWKEVEIDPQSPLSFISTGGSVSPVKSGRGEVTIAAFCDGYRTLYAAIGSSPALRICGLPFMGIHVLRDREEIGLPEGSLLIFVEEYKVRVARALPEGFTVPCALCGDPVIAPAVECPRCVKWYHENCWSAGEKCITAGCPQTTRISEGEETLHEHA